MIGELIPTGVTFGTGRAALNDQFSGTAEFNNVEVSGNLNLGYFSSGTSIANLGVDSFGNVVTGGTTSGDFIKDLSSTDIFKVSGNSASFEQILLQTNFDNTTPAPAELLVGRGSAQLRGKSGSTVTSLFRVESGSIKMSRTSSGFEQKIGFGITGTQMIVEDGLNLVGLEYNADYSSNYTNRSLVDKAYADSVVAQQFVNVGSASTFTWNVSGDSNNYEVTLTAATTVNISNVRNGDSGTLIVKQNPDGGKTLTLGTVNGIGDPSIHKVAGGGAGTITLTASANAMDMLRFTYNGTYMFWIVDKDFT